MSSLLHFKHQSAKLTERTGCAPVSSAAASVSVFEREEDRDGAKRGGRRTIARNASGSH